MRLLIAACAAVLVVLPAGATELRLAGSATREVTNDLFVAQLEARRVAGDPAGAQSELNTLVARAVAEIANTAGLAVETVGYAVFPERRDDEPERWVARQTVGLESIDRAVITTAVDELQALGLVTQNLSARLSDTRAEEVRAELLQEAIAAMRARAAVAAAALDLAVASWIEVRLDGGEPEPRAARADAMMAAEAAPAVSVGTTTVRVTVQGTADLVARAGP